jgi:hypothetical protein
VCVCVGASVRVMAYPRPTMAEREGTDMRRVSREMGDVFKIFLPAAKVKNVLGRAGEGEEQVYKYYPALPAWPVPTGPNTQWGPAVGLIPGLG